MSGSGRYGGYVPSPRSTFDCDAGIIITNLSSVDFDLLKKYSKGDILSVAITAGKVVVENGDGEVLGSVLHEHTNALKECIEQGYSYISAIVEKSDTYCKVRITKK